MLKKLTLAAVLALTPLAQAEVVDDPALTEPEITITTMVKAPITNTPSTASCAK
jgi:hypothetical protein